MLYMCLFLSLVFLAAVNAGSTSKKRWPTFAIVAILGFLILAFFGGGVFPALMLQVLLTGVSWLMLSKIKIGFRVASICSMVLAYAVAIIPAWQEMKENQQWRQQYAYESMEDRVPSPVSANRKQVLQFAQESSLQQVEKELETNVNSFRNWMLERLHHDSVNSFVNSPGFGVGRRLRPDSSTLKAQLPRYESIPHPGPPASSIPLRPEEKGPRPSVEAADKMHLASVLDFSNPMGFGLFKDRSKVAGFIPHQFTTVPEMTETWKVDAIDLIGLLIPEEPVAYVSEFLPRMEELKWAPKRPLDDFEKEGLTTLRSGEDYQFANTADALRMLGAIRAAKQCVNCHGCERGDLLGAFSYTLRKVGTQE